MLAQKKIALAYAVPKVVYRYILGLGFLKFNSGIWPSYSTEILRLAGVVEARNYAMGLFRSVGAQDDKDPTQDLLFLSQALYPLTCAARVGARPLGWQCFHHAPSPQT